LYIDAMPVMAGPAATMVCRRGRSARLTSFSGAEGGERTIASCASDGFRAMERLATAGMATTT